MPIDPRILQAIMAQAQRSQASPSPMGPQGTGAGQNAIGTTGIPANPMAPQQVADIPGMPMMPPQYTPLPGGAGASGDPMANWIGIQAIIKRLYPSASDADVQRMLSESQSGTGQPGY